jgi:hypothetical protein
MIQPFTINSNVALQKVDTTMPQHSPQALSIKALLNSLLLWIEQSFHTKVAMVKSWLTDKTFRLAVKPAATRTKSALRQAQRPPARIAGTPDVFSLRRQTLFL